MKGGYGCSHVVGKVWQWQEEQKGACRKSITLEFGETTEKDTET